MWPFDIKRKKREAEERAEQRRLSEERLTAAVRRSGRRPEFSMPYGKQSSSVADDSLLNPTSILSPLNPVSPVYHGDASADTGRWHRGEPLTSAEVKNLGLSADTGRSSGAEARCTGADYASYASASDSGCSSSSSDSSSSSGDSGGGGGGGD